MQELLTPKVDWEKIRLGDYGKSYGGLIGKSKKDFGFGSGKYIPFMNIMKNSIIDPIYLDTVDVKVGESQNKAICGDLYFNGSSETPEEVGLCAVLNDEIDNLYLNSFCFGYRLNSKESLNGLFLAYYFRSTHGRQLMFSLAQGSTRYNLSKTNLLKMELPIPSRQDQDSIALVLHEMNDEIDLLSVKYNKLIAEKQGMMQSLLTGKIRIYNYEH